MLQSSRVPPSYPSATARITTILLLCNVCSYSDRVVLNLLVHPIRQSLGISDTEISLLQGGAFALFYTLAIIPLGYLIDRSDRWKIIAWGGVIYSLSTCFCGVFHSFWPLFFGRLGVGAGEATLQPAASALLADNVPRHRLAGAMGVFHVGAYAGIGGGYILGGVVIRLVTNSNGIDLAGLGHFQPWQIAFAAAGLPSLIIALFVLSFMHDLHHSPRLSHVSEGLPIDEGRSLLEHLRTNAKLFVPLLLACALGSLVAISGLSWTPTFFIRAHHMSASETGLTIGVVILVFSSSGAIVGGRVADMWTKVGRRDGPVITAAIGVLMTALLGTVLPLWENRVLAIVSLAGREFFSVFLFPLSAAAIQMTTPRELRGRMSALYILVMSLTGNALGPTLTALLNDYVFMSDSGVRYSLALIYGVAAPIAAILFLISRHPFERKLREGDVAEPTQA